MSQAMGTSLVAPLTWALSTIISVAKVSSSVPRCLQEASCQVAGLASRVSLLQVYPDCMVYGPCKTVRRFITFLCVNLDEQESHAGLHEH